MKKQHSGTFVINSLLNGGYESSILTIIYGPSSSGKTCLCILAAIEAIKQGKKIIYIDTEGSFSIERAIQLYPEFQQNMDNFIFFKPTSFAQQHKTIEKLKEFTNQEIGLIILDSIAMFYRLEIAIKQDYPTVNKALTQQLLQLLKLAREKDIPILLTNQVYANFNQKNQVNMVGGDIVKYTSKCMIELKKPMHNKTHKAIIRKHRSIPEGKSIDFRIEEKGVF